MNALTLATSPHTHHALTGGPIILKRATNCRTTENKYELVAPNIRRSVFGVLRALEFSKEFERLSTMLGTLKT